MSALPNFVSGAMRLCATGPVGSAVLAEGCRFQREDAAATFDKRRSGPEFAATMGRGTSIDKSRDMMRTLMKSIVLFSLLLTSALTHANTVTYVYTDPQGTPLAEADASGNITATFDYAPYGKQALGTAPNGPGYTGHVNDPDTGLVYMQARYYDPAVGRFISTDPVGPRAGNVFNFNRFSYVDNNPILNIDPDGRCTGTHICNGDGTAVSTGTFTTRALAGDAVQARVATAQSRLNQAVNYLQRHEKDVSGSYSSPGNAASAFGHTFAKESGKLGVEFGANIISGLGDHRLNYSLTDFGISVDFFRSGPYGGLALGVAIAGRPGDPSYWGFVHTHWANLDPSRPFSWNDIQVMINRKVNGYLFFPNESSDSFDYSKYNPRTMVPAYVYWNQAKFSF
jgi:RHS repeat-associated protein